ncbi:MAG: repressor LexA [Candidatus Omnitrophica bacterium]|nr:repressor LexA [Candidatus Omnitrophota bacterium]
MKTQDISNKELEALKEIRNSLMHRGRIPSIRELMASLGYRSPRSAAVIYENLIEKGALRRKRDGNLQLVNGIADETVRAQTVDVPLVGTISCGIPVLAEENVEAMIPVSTRLAKPPEKYFLLRAKGDSMEQKGINDGDLLLIRQQTTSQNGDIVVALIDDEATVKEFHAAGETVVLLPRTSNKKHQPIVLTKDFQIQGVVITAIPKL